MPRSTPPSEPIVDRALNRALLARQGLLEPFEAPLADVVETIGAMQGQAYAALPVGLATRTVAFAPADLHGALERGELLWGIGVRATLHLVSAREHPEYAAAARAATDDWRRTKGDSAEGMAALRSALLAFAQDAPRTKEEVRELAESWVTAHPGAIDAAEVEAQRALSWRPIYRWAALVRAPADGSWTKAPADHLAAPGSGDPVDVDTALPILVRRHLRAFGPAAAEDVGAWIGWRTPPVRALLEADGELATFADEHGRTLYDLPDAPRPDPDVEAPVRFLGAFDSTLLAYAPQHRTRIVPEAHREALYRKKNLQIIPSVLVDGRVAGLWSVEVRRREATLTVEPLERLDAATRRALGDEGERLLRATQPEARAHQVAFA